MKNSNKLIKEIKKLRKMTNISVSECKKILERAKGNFQEALELLKKEGKIFAGKKKIRQTKEGRIGIYLHSNGKIAALVKVLCETDFASQNELFKKMVHEIAMQIAATNPKTIEELMREPWIKDEKRTVRDLIEETIFKIGENIKISDFKRMEI